jgi:hypothetical protein
MGPDYITGPAAESGDEQLSGEFRLIKKQQAQHAAQRFGSGKELVKVVVFHQIGRSLMGVPAAVTRLRMRVRRTRDNVD